MKQILAVLVVAVAGTFLIWRFLESGEKGVFTSYAAPADSFAPPQVAGTAATYNFDGDSAGAAPAKFHSARTGQGTEGKWAVMADATAPSKPNVVAQTSTDKTDYRFPLLIADEGSFKDLELSVRFKAVSGEVDRAAGLVFRLKDANNYYIVRANALEDNYRLYHVVAGSRRQFAGAKFKVTSGEWHKLRYEWSGTRLMATLDGINSDEVSHENLGKKKTRWWFAVGAEWFGLDGDGRAEAKQCRAAKSHLRCVVETARNNLHWWTRVHAGGAERHACGSGLEWPHFRVAV